MVNERLKRSDKNFLTLLCCSALFLLFPAAFHSDYLLHMGCMVGINVILALGLNLVTGNSGQINMGQYGFYAVGAYSAGLLCTKFGLGFWSSLVFVIVVSIFFGILIGVPALKVEGPYLAVCTIAFGESVRIFMENWDFAGQAMGIPNISSYTIFGHEITTKLGCYYFITAFVIVLMAVIYNLTKSSFGRKFLSVKDDTLAAEVMGVNIRNVKVLAFVICSIYAGIAGALYANYSGYVSPDSFLQAIQTNFMLMIVLGGLSSEWGSVLGAILVEIIYEMTRVYVQYQMLAFGIAMILVVLLLPRGILGAIKQSIEAKKVVEQHRAVKALKR